MDNSVRIVTIPARQSSRVKVSNARVELNGVYQCVVSNDVGSAMHSFVIELMKGKPAKSVCDNLDTHYNTHIHPCAHACICKQMLMM